MGLRKARPEPGRPCCWVATGNPSDGPICREHSRAVGDAVNRDAAAVIRPAVDLFEPLSDMDQIDWDWPDSATPGLDEERREGQ